MPDQIPPNNGAPINQNLLSNQQNIPVPLPHSHKRRLFWYWSITVLAAAGACALVLTQTLKTEDVQPVPLIHKAKIISGLPAGYKFTPIQAGQYPTGFPKDLVLEKSADPFRGEDTITGSGENQKIIEYYSSSTLDAVYGLYKQGVADAGWKLAVDTGSGQVRVLSFSKDANSFEVIITPHQTGSQVKLDYILPKQI